MIINYNRQWWKIICGLLLPLYLAFGTPLHSKESPPSTEITNALNSCALFEEANGLVVMEAENTASPLDKWIVKQDVAGYTGTGHLEYTGGGPDGSSGPADSPLEYTFKINKPGYYRMMIRARKRLEGAPSDRANDGFVRMIGDYGEGPNPGNNHNDDAILSDLQQNTKMSGGNANSWGWAEQLSFGAQDKRYTTYDFKAGETYTLVISGRSGRWNIDRVVLYHLDDVGVNNGKNTSNAESQCIENNAPTYAVNVTNGSGDGSFEAGESVQIQADPAPSGQVFDQWTGDVFVLSDPTVSNPTFTMPAQAVSLTATYVSDGTNVNGTGAVTLTGELKKWHKIVLSIDGPTFNETSSTNPFTDYRLNVTFTNGTNTFNVPGFFAADGDAAETSANSGNVWRVNFAPNATGTWNYTVSFRTGTDVAASIVSTDGIPVAPVDGVTGSFTVGTTDKAGPDLRAKGRLNYVGEHYYQFAETGDYFVKGATDSPENLLAFEDFDGTYDRAGKVSNWLHEYAPHVQDWNAGDPTWQGGKGKGLIGALNYIAEIGLNGVYFLTQNVNGDGDDTWPWTAHDKVLEYDCSKLDQWEIAMEHMDHKGLFINLVHQEQENDQYLNNGSLGTERKIYYRELIARFGHHLALQWNMGEECTADINQVRDWAEYIRDLDPYNHPIVLHTYPNNSAYDQYYGNLVGNPNVDGTSFQIHNAPDDYKTRDKLIEWIDNSVQAGKKWVVQYDEIFSFQNGLLPDADNPTRDDRRKYDLWGAYLAGSGGIEWYVGSEATVPLADKATSNRDRTLEDFRTREEMWRQTKIAREFMETYIPLDEVRHADDLVADGICLASKGDIYLVYLPDGGTTTLDLESFDGIYSVQWFDPRNGGALQDGSITQISGTGDQSLGNPPNSSSADWAILVTNIAGPNGINIDDFTATPPQVDNENLPADITFTATVTDEAPGSIASVSLDLTNLGGPASVAMTPSGDNYSYTFTFTDMSIVGGQQVILTATDNEGNTAVSTTTVTVIDGGVVLAINVGSIDYTSTEGIDYVEDIYSAGGTVSSKTDPISGTDDDDLYRTYVFGDYTMNVPIANGTYALRFQMMEPFATTVGQRVFDISAEGNNLVADVDIFQEVGMFAAYDIIVRDVVVTDGTLNIALTPSANNAILSGLVIYDNDNAPNPTAYTVTVTNGFGSGTFLPGENVQIEANPAPMGQVFDQWTGDTFVLSDPTLVSPIFVMPAQDVSLTATYRDENAVVYTVTVNNGSGGGNYEAGETVSIQADPAPSGQVFDQWAGDIFVLSDPTLASTNFTMPAQDLNLTATYQATSLTQTICLTPTNDAYLQDGSLRNDTMLRIEQDRRISYAMFDLGAIDGTITEATLEVFVTRDDGNGTLEIIKGLSNNWTETTLNTGNAPAEGANLATLNQDYNIGDMLSIDLDETGLTLGDLNSFILKQTSGNDFAFSSKEGSVIPELCLTYNLPPLSVDVRIFLEGTYDGTDMTHLFDDIMPTTEPYTTLGYTHVNGGGGETTTTSIISSESIVDWVVVELRDKTDNTQVVASRAALLTSDGRVVSHADGTSPVTFQVDPDDYFVAVHHRNHLKVMTELIPID